MKRSEYSPASTLSKDDDGRSGIAQAPSPSLKKSRDNPDDSPSSPSKAENGTAAAAAPPSDPHVEMSPIRSVPAAIAAAAKKPYDPTSVKGGPRIRLPDKLIEYLNNGVEKEVIWWQPDGDGFAFDSTTVQTGFLDKYFEGTKLKSFIRSLNRWGFRRIFYHTLPKTVFSFHHPLFKKDAPELTRQMKMLSYSGQQAAEMEEFNRRQRETGAASLPGSPIPATEAPSPMAVVAEPAASTMEIPSESTVTIPPVTLQQGVIQSLFSNPLYSNQVLQSLQEQQLLQRQEQLRQAVQQHQQQQQQNQPPEQQLNLSQALFLQTVLNMVQQQSGQQQSTPVQQQHYGGQQQQQQQLSLPPQQLPMTNLPTNANAQMFLPFHTQQSLLQQAQSAALIQYLSSQQRMDGTGAGTFVSPSSDPSSSSVRGNDDGKDEERELRQNQSEEAKDVNNENKESEQLN